VTTLLYGPDGVTPLLVRDEPSCRVCGCTDNEACEGGCWWVSEELCSECEEAEISASVAHEGAGVTP
jgi:hypothetical protein